MRLKNGKNRIMKTLSMEDKKFAILIDGDNTSSKYIKTIIDEVAKIGDATYKRIYGDWTKPDLDSWKKILLKYSIAPMQQYSYTTGKNATDSAMIIDAMDILYAEKVDGFCLVSSDSDFTRLATRLREAGKEVVGMGKKQTPEAFRNACNSFKYLDLIGNVSRQKDDKYFETAPSKTKINGQDKEVQNKETTSLGALVKQNEKDVKTDYAGDITPKERIKDEIDKIIDEQSDSEGWLLASSVGTLLQRLYSDFDCRIYGYKRFIDFLVEGLGYESKVSADKKVYSVRKPTAVKQPKSQTKANKSNAAKPASQSKTKKKK